MFFLIDISYTNGAFVFPGLSVADLCSLLTLIWTCIFITPAFVASDLPFESVEVLYLVSGIPHFAFTRVSSGITAMITLERCFSIVAPLQVIFQLDKCYITSSVTLYVCTLQLLCMIVKSHVCLVYCKDGFGSILRVGLHSPGPKRKDVAKSNFLLSFFVVC